MARSGNGYRGPCPLDCKVYVGDLGNNGDRRELEDAFGRYGPLRNVWVARNPPGFAFVEFEDPRDAEDASRELDGRSLCGRRVRVELSSGRTKPKRFGDRDGGGSGGRGYDRDRRGGGDSRGGYGRDDRGGEGRDRGGRERGGRSRSRSPRSPRERRRSRSPRERADRETKRERSRSGSATKEEPRRGRGRGSAEKNGSPSGDKE